MHPIRSISAVQVLYDEDGSETLGLLTQLPRESSFQACGAGFNERTVKVSFRGRRYFVFREDVEAVIGLDSKDA